MYIYGFGLCRLSVLKEHIYLPLTHPPRALIVISVVWLGKPVCCLRPLRFHKTLFATDRWSYGNFTADRKSTIGRMFCLLTQQLTNVPRTKVINWPGIFWRHDESVRIGRLSSLSLRPSSPRTDRINDWVVDEMCICMRGDGQYEFMHTITAMHGNNISCAGLLNFMNRLILFTRIYLWLPA